MLLGIPGDNTFANYRRKPTATFFLRQTVPAAGRAASAHRSRQWLSPQFGERYPRSPSTTDPQSTRSPADRRPAAVGTVFSNAAFLTLNEKREAVGYGPGGRGRG